MELGMQRRAIHSTSEVVVQGKVHDGTEDGREDGRDAGRMRGPHGLSNSDSTGSAR